MAVSALFLKREKVQAVMETFVCLGYYFQMLCIVLKYGFTAPLQLPFIDF